MESGTATQSRRVFANSQAVDRGARPWKSEILFEVLRSLCVSGLWIAYLELLQPGRLLFDSIMQKEGGETSKKIRELSGGIIRDGKNP
jgi:hypothetical protein